MKQEKKCCWSFQWIGASKITSGCVVSLTVISNRWEYVLLAGKKKLSRRRTFWHTYCWEKMTRDRGDKASYHSWRSSKEIQFDSRCFSLYGLMRLDDFFSIRKFRMFEKITEDVSGDDWSDRFYDAGNQWINGKWCMQRYKVVYLQANRSNG